MRGLGVEMSHRARAWWSGWARCAARCGGSPPTPSANARPPGPPDVEALDDELDELHVALTAEIVGGSMALPVAIESALVARFYERFGDHAVNLRRAASTQLARGAAGDERPTSAASLSPGGEQRLGDLHRVERRALAEVVAGHEERRGRTRRWVATDAADQRDVAAGGASGVGTSDQLDARGAAPAASRPPHGDSVPLELGVDRQRCGR